MNRPMRSQVMMLSALIALSMLGLVGCGKSSGGVSLKSKAFNSPAGALFSPDQAMQVQAYDEGAFTVAVSNFSFCVTQLKLEGEGGDTVQGEDGNDLIEARLGLINPGDGTTSLTWGTPSIPVGSTLKRIKIEIHKDPEACGGVDYSVMFNNNKLTKDVELIFTFPAGREISEGDSITLDLTQIATRFEQAYNAGAFTDELIGSYLEGLEGGAEEE